MKIRVISALCVLVAMIVLVPSRAHACSCLPFGNDFFETVYLHNQKVQSGEWAPEAGLTIVAAEVEAHLSPLLPQDSSPTDMEVEVIGVIQGEITTQRLVIQGGNGGSCEMPVETFGIDKEYLMALSKNKAGEYYMSLCGNYFIELSQILKTPAPTPQKPSPDGSL